jgi:pyruvate dehydrogenase E2 component (dihydrolipoamide acetyltransferase)
VAYELTMPKTGHIEDEATVYQWLKAEGDPVEVGEPVVQVETQKAILDVESFAGGALQRILVPEGETVPIGTVLAIIG